MARAGHFDGVRSASSWPRADPYAAGGRPALMAAAFALLHVRGGLRLPAAGLSGRLHARRRRAAVRRLGYVFGVFDLACWARCAAAHLRHDDQRGADRGAAVRVHGRHAGTLQVAEDLLETMGRLFGRLRGGLGLSVSLVGALLAASTGIVGATVVTMGLLSLPTMLQARLRPDAGQPARSAPPARSARSFRPRSCWCCWATSCPAAYQQAQLQQGIFSPETVSVGDLFAGALLPGLCWSALYIVYQIAVAWLRPDASPADAADVGSVSDGPAAPDAEALLPPRGADRRRAGLDPGRRRHADRSRRGGRRRRGPARRPARRSAARAGPV